MKEIHFRIWCILNDMKLEYNEEYVDKVYISDKEMDKTSDKIVDLFEAQEAEIKRLREALEEVHSHYIKWPGFCPILHRKIKGLLDVVSENRKHSGI